MALSEKHRIVADEYLRCFNRRQAYRAAYPGTSDTVASSNSWRLWQNPEMQKYISQRLTETAMSADEVLMRLAEQARGAHAEYIQTDGTIDIAQMVQDNKAHLIKKISYTKGRKEYDFHDAQAALVQLGKHHKLFTDKVEMSGDIDIAFVNVDVDKL